MKIMPRVALEQSLETANNFGRRITHPSNTPYAITRASKEAHGFSLLYIQGRTKHGCA